MRYIDSGSEVIMARFSSDMETVEPRVESENEPSSSKRARLEAGFDMRTGTPSYHRDMKLCNQ